MPDALAAPAAPAYVELARFHHADPAKACTDVLEAAGIPFRMSNDSLVQGLSAQQVGYHASCIVTVPAVRVIEARKALLQAAREEVAGGVGPEHPLATSDNETLLDVLRHPEESSEYDIAVAERLLRARGVTPPEVSLDPPVDDTVHDILPDDNSLKKEEPLPGTRRGNTLVLVLGYLLASTGGVVGVIIAWNLALATEPAQGRSKKRWVYDEATRRRGSILLVYAVFMLCLWLFLWVNHSYFFG